MQQERPPRENISAAPGMKLSMETPPPRHPMVRPAASPDIQSGRRSRFRPTRFIRHAGCSRVHCHRARRGLTDKTLWVWLSDTFPGRQLEPSGLPAKVPRHAPPEQGSRQRRRHKSKPQLDIPHWLAGRNGRRESTNEDKPPTHYPVQVYSKQYTKLTSREHENPENTLKMRRWDLQAQ